MKKSPEMVGRGWVSCHQRGEGEEEKKNPGEEGEEACVRGVGKEEEEEKNQGKKRA